MFLQKLPRLTAALALCGIGVAHAQAADDSKTLPICKSEASLSPFSLNATLVEDDIGSLYLSIDGRRVLSQDIKIMTSDDQNLEFIKKFVSQSSFNFQIYISENEQGERNYSFESANFLLPSYSNTNAEGKTVQQFAKVHQIAIGDKQYVYQVEPKLPYNNFYEYPVIAGFASASSGSWFQGEPTSISLQLTDEAFVTEIVLLPSNWGKFAEIIDRDASSLFEKYNAGQCQADYACFFTTAAVHTIGLTDNCWELTQLRSFRDEVMKRTITGRKLIEQYYAQAPNIVRRINTLSQAKQIWLKTYWFDILPNALLAKVGLNALAQKRYVELFKRLEKLALSA
ncbi:CFI-box-CTERM domain-containing protein [Pseudidiomarina woesei]|uniref:Uncharacterized protein n=1 Tax=Pseudidiomarina woesei TaxID=1381080 RepID=A0A0K6GWA2_9GAMM|nr:CFI-box-CTERM domain-containing protein [Pseudidiomarina woesei]CUA82788.1 hypothetical protein Ga0061064_0219 [Pseudidiomarina woesei]